MSSYNSNLKFSYGNYGGFRSSYNYPTFSNAPDFLVSSGDYKGTPFFLSEASEKPSIEDSTEDGLSEIETESSEAAVEGAEAASSAELGPIGVAVYALDKINNLVNDSNINENLNKASLSPYADSQNVANIANQENMSKGGYLLQDVFTGGTSITQAFSQGTPGLNSGVPLIPTVNATAGGLTTMANAV
jgi:hypothetical protein